MKKKATRIQVSRDVQREPITLASQGLITEFTVLCLWKGQNPFWEKSPSALGIPAKDQSLFLSFNSPISSPLQKRLCQGPLFPILRQAGMCSERAEFLSACSPGRKCYEKQAGTTSLLLKAGFLRVIIPVGAGIWRTRLSAGQSEAQRLALAPSPSPTWSRKQGSFSFRRQHTYLSQQQNGCTPHAMI